MFTVEHDTDFTIVTTLDQTASFPDVEVILDADDIHIRQFNEDMDAYDLIILSHQQFNDILSAMKSPEGAYYAK